MKVFVLSLLVLMLSVSPSSSDPQPKPPTLAEALRTLPVTSIGDGSVLLTVSAEQILPLPTPPPDPEMTMGGIELPPDVMTPDNLAAQYGRLPQRFGHVLALAPPTMTLLNTSPGLADLPISVLASQHPVPFFLGMLTREQLQQMSSTGLSGASGKSGILTVW